MKQTKITLLIFIALAMNSNLGYSQEDSGSNQSETDSSELWIIPAASYGMEFYRDKNFQSYFSDSLSTTYGQNLPTVNAGAFISVDNSVFVHALFSYRLPHLITGTDGQNYQLSGFSFGYGVALKYAPNKKFEMPFSGGYNVGKMYLWKNSDRMGNFFFDLYAMLSPRLVLFDRLVLFGTGALYWDVTKSRWKSKTIVPSGNLNFKHTCGAFQIGLGWKFEHKFLPEPYEEVFY